jgi:DNA-binding CsgD family transcriptional regulator
VDVLERGEERQRLEDAIRAAMLGSGRAVLVEAPAGLGKTVLLESAHTMATERGLTVLRARAAELEQTFAYGVARQMLESTVRRMDPAERGDLFSGAARLAGPVLGVDDPGPVGGQGADPGFATLHALYWVVAGLAERNPVVALIDDVHWADEASLRFLAFLAQRLVETPASVVMARRTGEPAVHADLVTRLAATASDVVELAPLSADAVEQILAESLDAPTARSLRHTAWETVGGNPFYLRQLIRGLGPDPSPHEVARVQPRALTQDLAIRIARLGRSATATARAITILGDGCSLSEVASLAGIDESAAASAVDALVDADILTGDLRPAFVHPIVRSAIHLDIGQQARGIQHRAAARLLMDREAAPERIAAQFLHVEPGRDPAAVAALRAAAHDALARGAPETADTYLSRALAEPPPEDERAAVTVELGIAQALAWRETAIACLADGVAHAAPATSFVARRVLAAFLGASGAPHASVTLLAEGTAALADEAPDLGEVLAADLAGSMTFADGPAEDRRAALPPPTPRPAGDTPARRARLAAHAFEAAKVGMTVDATRALAEGALADGRFFEEQPPLAFATVALFLALAACGEITRAEEHADALLVRHRNSGTMAGVAFSSCILSHLRLRRGAVVEAEAHGRFAAETTPAPMRLSVLANHAFLLDALLARGSYAEATAGLKEAGLDGELTDVGVAGMLLERRGRLRAATGDAEGGRADLLAAGARHERWGLVSPALSSWRSEAAIVHSSLGDEDTALALAAEDLERARAFGAPRPIAVALRARGLIRGGQSGIDDLREAADLLGDGTDPLDRARALIDLGASLRRRNRRTDARPPLREGLDLAHRCGAQPLASRAHDELRATGARPRRLVVSGVDALTASEARVARMAATGLTNKAIAQALYVSLKTVELHLSSTYRKLGIEGRDALPEALGTPAQVS